MTEDTSVQQCKIFDERLAAERHRRVKIGEHLEVLDFAPQHRELALELPRSYREKAVARFKRMAINLRDPSDWEDAEIRENLSSLAASIKRRRATFGRMRSANGLRPGKPNVTPLRKTSR